MNLSVGIGASVATAVKAEASVKAELSAKVMAQTIASATVSCLAQIRDQLLAAGLIKIEDELEVDEDFPDEENDAEIDLSDEDEMPDWEYDGGCETVDDPFADLFGRDAFEIKVVKVGDKWHCEVTQSGWEGIVAASAFGMKVVKAVSTRMQVYLFIATWLEENHQRFLERGPFRQEEPLLRSQVELLGELRKDKLLNDCLGKTAKGGDVKDHGASSLSRYLENVDLVWPGGAIPLKKCFGG